MLNVLTIWKWNNQPLLSRFRLLMALAAAPCLFLLLLYVRERNASIAFSQDEMQGARYIEPLLGMRLAALETGKISPAELNLWQAQELLLGKTMNSGDQAQALKAELEHNEAGNGHGMVPSVRRAWNDLLVQVTDQSKLILDPDLDSFYLMDATCLSLPRQLEHLDGMADILADAKRRGSTTQEDVLRLQLAVSTLQTSETSIIRNYGIIINETGGSAHKGNLQPLADAYAAALKGLVPVRQTSVVAARRAHAQLWQASLKSLSALLQRRIYGLEKGLYISLTLSLLVLGLGWWLAKQVVQSVLEPVKGLQTEVSLLQKGDLRERARSGAQDELGELADGIEALRLRLVELPAQLDSQSQRMVSNVLTLKKDHLLQGSILESQASALAQTQVTSEEIRQTSRQAAAQAKSMLEEAAKARELIQAGGEAMNKSLDSLLAIRSRVKLLASDVESLEGRARRIEGIIDSVKDLADQSNLLALNAAIEAMRAGVHGQGFGLVAREIRALADQSIAATEQVRQVLGDLNDGVRAAAKASREGVTDIQKGLERVQGSAETMADIQLTVGDSIGQLQRIAAVVQQQDQGMEQVFLALKDQVERMHEAEQQQQRTAEAVKQLDDAVAQVQTIVASFKV